MKKTDLAYFAGLFDGEGCVHIARMRNAGSETVSYLMSVSINITQEYIAQLLRFAFGGSVSKTKRQNEKWKDIYLWRCWNETAENFLRLVYPFLILKKPQAEVAFKFQKIKPMWATGPHSRRTPNRVLAEAEAVVMEKLNKRGN